VGAATAVSNRVSRRQANRWAQQGTLPAQGLGRVPAAAPPATPAAGAVDPIEQLTKLAELHKQGVLTDAEFAAQKAKILA